jgi:branched-chain amino acid transport system ATP-binding protein
MTNEVLRLESVKLGFGGLQVLHGVDLTVHSGEVCGLVGPNGSGKSTLLNVATRLLDVDSGEVRCKGRNVTKWAPHRLGRLGVRRTFQQMRFSEDATALDNILVSLYCDRTRRRELQGGPRALFSRRRRPEVQMALDMLERMGALEFADWRVNALSHGSRRKVEFSRALISAPDVLLLDEATSGVSEAHVALMREAIEAEAARGCGILLVDHDLKFVSDVCHRVVVLDAGQLIFDGPTEEAIGDPRVVAAYVGE